MAGRSSDKIRDLIAFEVQRARGHYRAAAPGIALLAPSSQGSIRAAYHIYGGILDEIAGQGFDVFTRRATVPNRRRLALALRSLLARPGEPVALPGPDAVPALTKQRVPMKTERVPS